jgi:hypothetical protein
MTVDNWIRLTATVALISFIAILCLTGTFAHAKHYIANADPEIAEWYKQLKLKFDTSFGPRTQSCCGAADAYWCDQLGTEAVGNGDTVSTCFITDDREVPGRTPIPMGTKIYIPNDKFNTNAQELGGNPTGHSIVFIASDGVNVYCFVPGTLG